MAEKEIVYIAAEHIRPHPENPRKDLGDLEELVESIKKNGILQNLAVIPVEGEPGEYMTVIGHRRYAAGIIAGVAEFPCQIRENLTLREQMSIMLEENMQRNDLTILEQANGFQMMLDLGETEESIAEKTGFSKATVKHRLNIAKLNQKELQKKEKDESFQLTLKDLYELEKIEDIKTRDRVLKEARDSRDLVWKAKQAVTAEIKKKNEKQFAELFKKAGIKKAPKGAENEKYGGKWQSLQEWDLEKGVPKTLKKFKEEDAQWVVYWGRTVAVIIPARKQKRELSEYEIKEKEKAKAKKELKQKHKAMYAEVDRFLMGIITKEIKPLKEDLDLYKDMVSALIKGRIEFYRSDLTSFYCGKGLYELEHDEPEKYQEFVEWEKNLSPLHMAIAYMSGIKKCEMYGYNVDYSAENADRVKAVVGFLAKYGFSVSEEEQQIIDGTHELYQK